MKAGRIRLSNLSASRPKMQGPVDSSMRMSRVSRPLRGAIGAKSGKGQEKLLYQGAVVVVHPGSIGDENGGRKEKICQATSMKCCCNRENVWLTARFEFRRQSGGAVFDAWRFDSLKKKGRHAHVI